MGIKNNTIQTVIVTALGLQLRNRYLEFMQKLSNNDLIDWNEIREELNGHYNEYLMPTGIMADNIDTIMKRCEFHAISINPDSANKTEYAFNFADMEDDAIQELIEAGYIKILD